MVKVLNEYFSSVFTTDDTSSLPVPATKFEGDKSDNLGQLYVTPEMLAKKIKKTKERIVPSEWKEANVTPLFKKGSRNKSENHRPVSLTSIVCKLLETLIRDHMVEFIVKHKLINASQHGFLKARSCLINLLCFLEDIIKWVDDGSPVDVFYLDFQKAFHKMPRQRLLLKLKAHGIANDVINWIKKWLTRRRQSENTKY